MHETVKVEKAPSNPAAAIGRIDKHSLAYRDKGGPDLEAEDIELAKQFKLDTKKVHSLWNRVRKERAEKERPLELAEVPTPKIIPVFEPVAAPKPAAPAQPKPKEPEPAEEEPPRKAAINRSPWRAKPKEEPKAAAKSEPKPKEEAEPEEKPKTKRGSVIVDTKAPYEVARLFLVDRYSLDGALTLRLHRQDWRRWTGTHYAVMEDDALRAEVYDFLAKVNHEKFDPEPKHVNAVLDGLRAWAFLSEEVEFGTWLGDGEAPWGDEEILVCKNGILRLRDGRLWPHDPRLFAVNVIETEYRPEARAPRWEQFLNELWSDDAETKETMQEFFGLALTDETRFQKGFILVGPSRSGKGTIARVLMHLLGSKNFCGPSLGHLSQPFGMQGLIGKKIAVVPDARLDQRANRSVITEKLLSIIGEDVQEINRKNKPFWSGILRCRVLILSNELPDFKDDTGVIATRFIILITTVSFLGREDNELEGKLRAELSGILNWALVGWRRLVERGKFIPPGASAGLNDDLAAVASSIKAFVVERCELSNEYTVRVDILYDAYRSWAEGSSDRLRKNLFSVKLRAAFPGQIGDYRPRVDNPERKRMLTGIRLRKTKVISILDRKSV